MGQALILKHYVMLKLMKPCNDIYKCADCLPRIFIVVFVKKIIDNAWVFTFVSVTSN